MAITDITARNAVVDRISSATQKQRFVSDWTRAKYLARGERIVGIVGGLKNSIIHSPRGARGDSHDCDMLFFYGPNGVLVHEEPYITETAPEVLRELA